MLALFMIICREILVGAMLSSLAIVEQLVKYN